MGMTKRKLTLGLSMAGACVYVCECVLFGVCNTHWHDVSCLFCRVLIMSVYPLQ